MAGKIKNTKIKTYLLRLAEDKLDTAWARIIKKFLYLISVVYALAVRIMVFGYQRNMLKTHRLACRVISVGNITWGGTGKTPLVELLVRYLKKEGKKVVILSRGFRAGNFAADEPQVYQLRWPDVPVVVGRNRYLNGEAACRQYQPDAIILDDGFQHWSLYRDLDIVAIDASAPFGNYQLLPRGILREPLPHLKRADIFVLTRVDIGANNLSQIHAVISVVNKNALIVESVHRLVGVYEPQSNAGLKLSCLKNSRVALVCAIGNPRAFEQAVADSGADVIEKFIFLDHYNYTPEDILNIKTICEHKGIGYIVTTEKDWVRLKPVYGSFEVKAWIIRVELEIVKNEKEFTERLFSIYRG